MVAPTNHFLVVAPAAAVSFGVGAAIGYACTAQVQKIYEWAKCKFSEGIYHKVGKNRQTEEDIIIKEVDCNNIRDIFAHTFIATALCSAVALLGSALVTATGAPAFIGTAFMVGTIAAPIISGIIHGIAKWSGACRTVVIKLTPEEAKKIEATSISQSYLSGHYEYTGFPFPGADQPRECFED